MKTGERTRGRATGRMGASLLLGAGLLWARPAWGAEYIDEIVVLVGGEAITATRIAFKDAFLQQSAGEGMGRPLVPADYATPRAVQRLLEEDAIIDEMAQRLPLLQPSPQEIQAQIRWFRGTFESLEAYQGFVETWGFSQAVQEPFFARRLRIAAFIDLKVGDFEALSPRELEAYYDAHVDRYEGRPLEAVRGQVEAEQRSALRRARFQAWMDGYRQNHRDAIRAPTGRVSPDVP